MKDKEGNTITKGFQEILDDKSGCQSNKIWVDKASESYHGSIKWWLLDNDIQTHSTHNEEKTVAAEKLVRSLKNKIYKYDVNIENC